LFGPGSFPSDADDFAPFSLQTGGAHHYVLP
jgi:hypothetical protein